MNSQFDEAKNDDAYFGQARANLIAARLLLTATSAPERQELESLLTVAIGEIERLMAKQVSRPR